MGWFDDLYNNSGIATLSMGAGAVIVVKAHVGASLMILGAPALPFLFLGAAGGCFALYVAKTHAEKNELQELAKSEYKAQLNSSEQEQTSDNMLKIAALSAQIEVLNARLNTREAEHKEEIYLLNTEIALLSSKLEVFNQSSNEEENPNRLAASASALPDCSLFPKPPADFQQESDLKISEPSRWSM